jgi:hypothetical protein
MWWKRLEAHARRMRRRPEAVGLARRRQAALRAWRRRRRNISAPGADAPAGTSCGRRSEWTAPRDAAPGADDGHRSGYR